MVYIMIDNCKQLHMCKKIDKFTNCIHLHTLIEKLITIHITLLK